MKGQTLQNATRKLRVVRVGLRQMDVIGFRPRHNPVNPLISSNRVENQSKPCSHLPSASSEARELMVSKCIEPLAKPGRGNVLVARTAANRGRRGRRPSHALGFASTSIAMGILHFLFAICRGIVYSVGVCRFLGIGWAGMTVLFLKPVPKNC